MEKAAEMAHLMQDCMVSFEELYCAAYEQRTRTVNLVHFSPDEFGMWWPFMCGEFLKRLDMFRQFIGVPVYISPHPDALGRLSNNKSQHYPSPLVACADVMPDCSLERAYKAARLSGFHGIGVYPDWRPRPGLHLDLRPDRSVSDPALWSARLVNGKQTYGPITDVIKEVKP